MTSLNIFLTLSSLFFSNYSQSFPQLPLCKNKNPKKSNLLSLSMSICIFLTALVSGSSKPSKGSPYINVDLNVIDCYRSPKMLSHQCLGIPPRQAKDDQAKENDPDLVKKENIEDNRIYVTVNNRRNFNIYSYLSRQKRNNNQTTMNAPSQQAPVNSPTAPMMMKTLQMYRIFALC